MNYFTTEKLLTYPPVNALLIATNEKLGLSLHPSYVAVGEVYEPVGLLAKVEISSRTEVPNSEELRFTGKGWVVIDRIDISTFFDGQYAVTYDGAITSYDVARIITEQTGILFDERDFPDTVITAQSNKLVVSPRSLRWVGELTIVPA